MNDRDIDRILREASAAKPEADAALLDRIAKSMGSSIAPVRPLPASWILASGLILICAVVAVGGALLLGPRGFHKMNGFEIGLIFPVLGFLTWLGAILCVAEHVPGSRRPIDPRVLVAAGSVLLVVVFAVVFTDYRTVRFVPEGIKCLVAGLVHAIPVSAATWWLLGRGVALNPRSAGLAKGAIAGLAGITMLEIHCANFEALHVMVWHVAVLPISAALAWRIRSRGLSR